jgi:hypothetical protein
MNRAPVIDSITHTTPDANVSRWSANRNSRSRAGAAPPTAADLTISATLSPAAAVQPRRRAEAFSRDLALAVGVEAATLAYRSAEPMVSLTIFLAALFCSGGLGAWVGGRAACLDV